jgi:hypothetical protein
MAYKNMTRTDFNSGGGIYHESISISAGTYSTEVILPVFEMYAIAATITGDGDLEFTNDPPSVIEAATADWVAWDGSSLINLGMTGFRVKRNAGTVSAKVTAKTTKA